MASGSRSRSGEPREVLLVEDNPGDVRLIEDAFEMVSEDTELRTATDSYEALHLLHRGVTDDSTSLPDLALVDLNLPGKDGCELLESIRDDPHIECLPVIILTSSESRTDITRCYEAGANAYITKPSDPDEYVRLAEMIEQFWYQNVQLPPIPS
ncbi:response regulator [Natronobacterium texcoconense]|uniref:Response regulator receiver domain-containing protein n=1 Tax=Natronobacterium texcoconense TaxID=1095778 RepID=A0A1H1IYM2_NATTX|nr:response regulator [Natronobacterium texcoconense]SDR42759.1 Response regulator receiver domain-containing protein [Natronobacterium texcoconense]